MSPTTHSDEVLVNQEGSTLVVTLNRPAQRNAVTLAAAEMIAEAMDRLDSDDSLVCGVLTGGGGQFCAGMDLKRFGELGERPYVPGRGFAGLVEQPPGKPLVAAVEGWALGGGFEMVLSCDITVAARSARFGLPEVSRGLVARGGGLFRLPRVLPRQVALQLALTGTPIDSSQALRLGLVSDVVEDGHALETALAVAAQIARNAPLAVMASKRIVRESWTWPESECFDRQRAITDAVFASHDAAEGAQAFADGREPAWTGT